ncbi:MAG: hypothetical protein PHN89_04800 [Candidatus Pacebacteria bacterium]|nr:hypothetical protein [Candidatus Paceibacterota bacterium]
MEKLKTNDTATGTSKPEKSELADTCNEHEAPEEHESALMTAEDRFISEGTKDHEYHF